MNKMILLKAYCYDINAVIVHDYISGNIAIAYDDSNYILLKFNERKNDWDVLDEDDDYNYILEKYNRIVCANT